MELYNGSDGTERLRYLEHLLALFWKLLFCNQNCSPSWERYCVWHL